MAKLCAVRGWVVCKDVPPKEKSNGGILLPESAQKFTRLCRVISVDERGWLDGPKPGCKEGDIVLVSQLTHHIQRKHTVDSGSVINVDGEAYRFVPCQEIIAILEDQNAKSK